MLAMMLLASLPGMAAALFVLWVDRHAPASAAVAGPEAAEGADAGGQAAEGRRFAARGPPASHATPARDTTERPADAISRAADTLLSRSEERRVGKECVSTCSFWWSPDP